MLSYLPCFLFRDMVRDFHRPSLCRLADVALPTPEPRSKLTLTLPSDSSRDMKSFYRGGHGEIAVRYCSGNTSSDSSAIKSSFVISGHSCQTKSVINVFIWWIMCCLANLVHLKQQCLHCQICCLV